MEERSLLLVDDDTNVLLTLGAILSRAGFSVTTASSPSAAIHHIATKPFDILVTDLNIGEPGDGFTVVSALRRIHPDAAALLITGFPAFEAALQAIRNQVDDFLVKPVSPGTVLSAIERISKTQSHELPLPLKSVSEIVRENSEAITKEWSAKMRQAAQRCGHGQISREELINHLPDLLNELCARVDARNGRISAEARNAAVRHGQKRKEQQFSPTFLLNESTALRESILGVIHHNMLAVDLSSLFLELAVMSDSLDDQLKIAMQAYLEESK